WLRRTAAVIVATAAVLLSAFLCSLPARARPATTIGRSVLLGLVVTNLGFAASAALAAARTALASSQNRAIELSPQTPATLFVVWMGPIVLIAALPLAVFCFPFAVAMLRWDPLFAIVLSLLGCTVVGWASVGAIGLVAALHGWLGPD